MSDSKQRRGQSTTGGASFAPVVLEPSDPPPVETLNRHGKGPFLLGCEHAGNKIPSTLGRMGLTETELTRHIAWDIGARRLTERLSDQLDSPAVLQRYSRLVYDCNRTVEHEGAFVVETDGTHVAANEKLTAIDRSAREREIYRPFHQCLTALIESRRASGQCFAFVAIHSFNETVRGHHRPWQVGFIYNQQSAMSKDLIRWFRQNTNHEVGDNEPYSPVDAVDHTIRVQAEVRDIPYTMIEVRNDLLRSDTGIAHWADLIARSLQAYADTKLR